MDSQLKLFRETTWETTSEILQEETSNSQPNYYIKGITIQCNIKNKNSRYYGLDVIQESLDVYNRDFIVPRGAYGELGHPNSPIVNPDRVSHLFLELIQDGNNFISKAKVLPTPLGNIVKTFIDEKTRIGISSRATGALKEQNGTKFVQRGMKLITPGDIVCDPAGPEAFVQGICESVEYDFIDENIAEQVKRRVKSSFISTMSTEEKQKVFFEGFSLLLKMLKNGKKI